MDDLHHLFLYDGKKGWLTLVFHDDGTVTWEWRVLGDSPFVTEAEKGD